MEANEKLKILSGLFWKLLERCGSQGIQFIVQIILARLLMPEYYGIIAIVAVFISFSNVIIQKGFSTALVQKKDVDDTDLSSVFYLNIVISSIIYIMLFISSPSISSYYQMPLLVPLVRVLSITLFFGAINSIQNAVLSRDLQFKKYFVSSLFGIVVSAIVGISMAILGYGIWALVAQQLTNNIFVTIFLWFTVKWRLKLVFSLKRLKVLFSFGWKVLCSSVLSIISTNLYTLIIGKAYNSEFLGYYSRGNQIPQYISDNLNTTIISVMLPVFSAHQDEKDKLKSMVRRSIVTTSFVIFPIMIGLCVIADPLIKIILTEKWLPAVPFMQMACIMYAFYPLHASNLQAINAVGRSDIFLKLEVAKKIVELLILFISIRFGIYAIAAGCVISSLIAIPINASPNKKLLNYGLKEQLMDIFPSLILSIFMGVIVYLITFFNVSSIVTLFIQVVLGIIIYIIGAVVFQLECFTYLKGTLISFVPPAKMRKNTYGK